MEYKDFVARVAEVALVTPAAAGRIADELLRDYLEAHPMHMRDLGEADEVRLLQMLRRRQRAGELAPAELKAAVEAAEAVAEIERALEAARARRDEAISKALGEGAPPKVLCVATGLSPTHVRALRPADSHPGV